MASGSGDGNTPDLPRGLIDRRGTPAGKGRLTTLRGPRDLTLGGFQKRVFVPNIPSRRERSAPTNNVQPETKQREKSKERSDRGRDRGRGGRGRGRGRGESNVIQTHSVFEHAPAVLRNKAPEGGQLTGRGWGGGGGGGGGGRSGGGGGQGGAVPMTVGKSFCADGDGKVDMISDLLLRTDFTAGPRVQDDYSSPSCLPRCKPVSARREVKRDKMQPSALSIKQEPEDVEMASTSDIPMQTSLNSEVGSDGEQLYMQPEDLLLEASTSGKEMLALVQIPNGLPGTPLIAEKQAPAASTSKDSSKENEEEDKTCQNSLQNFCEGYLGKMRVRRSGKVELVLGNYVLNVTSGLPATALQELVSIHTEEENQSMTVLGHIKQKMVITPDLTSTLQAIASEKS